MRPIRRDDRRIGRCLRERRFARAVPWNGKIDVMADPVSWYLIERGWKVVAADGSEVGQIEETLADEDADIFDGLSISTQLLGKPRYVPSEQVAEIVEGTVHLALSAEQVAALGEYSR